MFGKISIFKSDLFFVSFELAECKVLMRNNSRGL